MFTDKLAKRWNAFIHKPGAGMLLACLLAFAAGVVIIALEKPTGAIAGRIRLEEEGFNLSTYDVRGHKVYALALGPRGGEPIERGAWVQPDGSFRINQLPVGEYTLRIRAEGFATAIRSGVFVDEAAVSTLSHDVQLSLLAPSVNIGSNARVFTTNEAPRFWINAQGSDRVTVRLYRKDILALMSERNTAGKALEFSSSLNLYKPYRASQSGRLFEDEKPLQTLERKLESDTSDWARADFKLNRPLPPGEYIATAEVSNIKGQKDWNVMWFSVSDMGLVIKQAPEKTVVRAIDLNTLQPLPGVAIRLMSTPDSGSNAYGTALTGTDGFATLPIPASQRNQSYFNLLTVGTHGKNRAFGGVWLYNEAKDSYETYFYTERPVYRLGQTLYYKGISRLRTADGFRTPKPGLPLQVKIEDPDNSKLWEGRLTANAHGTFNGTWQIPEDGKTGAYQLTIAYPDGTESYQRFEVAQYRKPEYQVDVLPLEPRVTAGGKARVRIRANYYFGAPVANARVKYSVYAASDWSGRYKLMPRPAWYGYYDDWDGDDDDYEDHSYAGDYISEGYAQTDETGEAVVEFDTRAMQLPKDAPYSDYEDKRYTVQAEVTDLSRIAVIGSGVQSVTAGDFALFVQPRNDVSRAGEPVQAEVTAVDYDGRPVANRTVEISLARWPWDSVNDTYRSHEVVRTQTVTTDAQGHATVHLETADRLFTDNYYLSAQAQDDDGHVIYDQSGVWIASENAPYLRDGLAARQEAFSIRLDKKAYNPGDVARAMITAPLTGKEQADVLVAVEGSKLHSVKVVRMDATAKLVEIPLTDRYAPNVYVTATLVAPKKQFYSQSEMIKVSPQAHFLNIAITTDKPRYKPGETAVYTLKATHPDGKPAANTELSLGVVDESIYAIRPEAVRDIRKFFYSRIYNAVTTLSSFPEEYSGGPDKTEPRLRKDFRDMAAWLPMLVTGKDGIATAKVKLPDNLTTWRATVRGIHGAADVGSAVSKVLATQDLIVRLALPRFFTQYDEGELTAIVHNYTDRDQKVSLKLKPSGQFDIRQTLVKQVTVHPDGAEREAWPMTVRGTGKGVINIQAVGQTDGDALETSVPIRPLGIEMTQNQAGVMKDDPDALSIPMKLPAEVTPDLAQLMFSVAASSIGPMLGGFDALIDYPYGCTEQTMSRLTPSIVAWQLHQKLGVPLNDATRARFGLVRLKALAKLKEHRNGDGGWGWWRYDASSPAMTATVMEGMALLEQSDAKVSDEALGYRWREEGLEYLDQATKALVKQLADPKLASTRWHVLDRQLDLAHMHYVLSLYGKKPDAKATRYLMQHLNGLPPEALAWITLSFKHLEQTSNAKQSYAALNKLAQPANELLSWDHTLALRKQLGFKDSDYTYRFTGVEATALGLQAATAMEAPGSSRLEAIERWLLFQRNVDGWDNTKTTAQVLRALMEKTLASGKPGDDTHYTATSNLWDEPIHLDASNWALPERVFTRPYTDITGQMVTLDKRGPGSLFYHSLLTYYLPLKPNQIVPQKTLPNGLSLRRAFYRIQAEPVGPEGTMRFKTSGLDGNRVRAGETLLMKVIVDSPVALPYVIVDAALPSGGEVVSNDPRESLVDESTSDDAMNGDWGAWWWQHQDILDDRVVMFATSLPAGKSEFHALVRMELPGTFNLNPVRLEGMYSKAINAYSPLDRLIVGE